MELTLSILNNLYNSIDQAKHKPIDADRRKLLKPLINYILEQYNNKNEINLTFVCTHNSRRSQLAQIWAQTAADFYQIPVNCFSGGTKVTSFNSRAIEELNKEGFEIATNDDFNNPKYKISSSEDATSLLMYSKLYDADENPKEHFAAVMTCDHADENCPFIPGASARFPLYYEDPKKYDNTSQEEIAYSNCSLKIASEMLYVFSKVAEQI